MKEKNNLSKKYIAEALIHLMKKKSYDKITNKEITDKAGLSHITIYRNFNNKDEILTYYLNTIFEKWKLDFDDKDNIAYNIFLFFEKNKEIIDLLYKANLQYALLNNILNCLDYKKDDINVIAYSKVTVAYLIFGWCDEWYKRGMIETPEEMSKLFNAQKNNE